MEMRFNIPKERLGEAKKEIRSLSSLRFLENPQELGDNYRISLSGNVGDVNRLNKYLSNCNEGEQN
jgi:hypothetical protein